MKNPKIAAQMLKISGAQYLPAGATGTRLSRNRWIGERTAQSCKLRAIRRKEGEIEFATLGTVTTS